MFHIGAPLGLAGTPVSPTSDADDDQSYYFPPPRPNDCCAICLGSLIGPGMPAAAGCRCSQGHACHAACAMELLRLSGRWQRASYCISCPLCAAAAPKMQSDQGADALVDSAAAEYVRAARFTSPGSPARDLVGQQCLLLCQGALARDPAHPNTLYLLGLLLLNGIGLPQDTAKARAVFSKVDRLGDPRGTVQLARLWRHGEGGAKNAAMASELLAKAEKQNDTVALLELAIMYKVDFRDFRQARGLFARAADRGDPLGALELGLMCKDGVGGPADPVLARSLLQLAHHAGFALATWELASMLKEGMGGEPDADEANRLVSDMKAPCRDGPESKTSSELLQSWMRGAAAKEVYALEVRALEESGEWWQLGWGPPVRSKEYPVHLEDTQLWDADEDQESSGSRSDSADADSDTGDGFQAQSPRRPAALDGKLPPTWSPTVQKTAFRPGTLTTPALPTQCADATFTITKDVYEADHPRCCVVS
mmetsp:Transcript_31635/g.73842  ORF Transcript_31635/g.73842 Transcript_31635/m.73842 type:complete len:481 (+) Transcript_31635:187-1629(+)